jgi:hypothetical protein
MTVIPTGVEGPAVSRQPQPHPPASPVILRRRSPWQNQGLPTKHLCIPLTHIPSYRILFGLHKSSSCRMEKLGTAGSASQDAGKSLIHRGFGKGPISVGPLGRLKSICALAPEVSSSRPRRFFPQPVQLRRQRLQRVPALAAAGTHSTPSPEPLCERAQAITPIILNERY